MSGDAGRVLFDAWQGARARGLNNRAAALDAGVSEAELIASACGRGAARLDGNVLSLLQGLPALGEIKSVIRNAAAVQERSGRMMSIETAHGSVRVCGDTFLLCGDIGAWVRGFALTETGKYGIKRSIQFFTAAGTSAAKFFLTGRSDEAAYRSLVRRFEADDQGNSEGGIAEAAQAAYPARRQARAGSLADCLFEASRLAVPVEVTVANDVASQVTVKTLQRIKRSDRGGWINVLDAGLDLHLHEDRIGTVQATGSGEDALLRWYADDGGEALSMRVESGGTQLIAAATRGKALDDKR